jgi:cation:H+ antiporter
MIFWLLIGGLALWGGSELLVDGAVDLATLMGVSERVISVTIIAIGTSVPELAASVIAALKQEKALSLGNLIGSNIFNIASVLGITAMIQPIVMQSNEILSNDIFWMLGIAFVLIPLVFLPKRYLISRYKGIILFVGYVVFMGLTFLG